MKKKVYRQVWDGSCLERMFRLINSSTYKNCLNTIQFNSVLLHTTLIKRCKQAYEAKGGQLGGGGGLRKGSCTVRVFASEIMAAYFNKLRLVSTRYYPER